MKLWKHNKILKKTELMKDNLIIKSMRIIIRLAGFTLLKPVFYIARDLYDFPILPIT